MTSYPAVFSATPPELGESLKSVRQVVANLPEGRMYAAAFVLAAMVNRGSVTWWRDWADPVPTPISIESPRRAVESVLWSAFGFAAGSVLEPGSPPLQALGNPGRVLVDPFFDAQRPERVTVVKYTEPGTSRGSNSVKVAVDDGAWIWSSAATGAGDTPREYNPVNTFNQQNGIKCALPAASAGEAAESRSEAYATLRIDCEHYGAGNLCALNGQGCASDGAGGTRIPKPRLLVPSQDGRDDALLTPAAFTDMVERARTDKESGGLLPLPAAMDVAVLVGWAQTGSGARLDFGPLVSLLGGALLNTLLEP